MVRFEMKSSTLTSDALLLTTAVIWGGAFVAQRMGMESLGPFAFNGLRFALGSLFLIPIIYLNQSHRNVSPAHFPVNSRKMLIAGGTVAGVALFAGASLQQVGLVYTTAGKAGFITGLYVVIVPILGITYGQRSAVGTWVGALFALVGMYLLSVTGSFTIDPGDLLVLASAFFWALHVLIIGWLSPRVNALPLAAFQNAACAALSLAIAGVIETTTAEGLIRATVPILYGGIMSVGVAYTLQVVAQKNAHPAHAAILLSLEAVFAALAGWLILDEQLSARGIAGCCLMLAGMLISQLHGILLPKTAASHKR